MRTCRSRQAEELRGDQGCAAGSVLREIVISEEEAHHPQAAEQHH
jgi:hypothetical protein